MPHAAPLRAMLVVHFAHRHYVLRCPGDGPDADASYEDLAARHIVSPDARWSKTRADALVLAHNIDNAVRSAHGVREVFLGGAGHGGRKRDRADGDGVDA